MKQLHDKQIGDGVLFELTRKLKFNFRSSFFTVFVAALFLTLEEFDHLSWLGLVRHFFFYALFLHYLACLFFIIDILLSGKAKEEFGVSHFDVVTIHEKEFNCEYCQLADHKWVGMLNEFPEHKIESSSLYGIDCSLKHLAEDIAAGRTPQTHYV